MDSNAFCEILISIHALCEEGDPPGRGRKKGKRDFYPRPLRGGRPADAVRLIAAGLFLSTPSARRATFRDAILANTRKFLSTPSARRATPRPSEPQQSAEISIHALCEEGDGSASCTPKSPRDFYPRPLRGGRPAPVAAAAAAHNYFYPRPLRGGRRSL